MTPYLEEEDTFNLEPEFSNEQIYPLELPKMAILEYSPLEKNLLKADIIWSVLFYGIGFIASLALRFIFEMEWMIDFGIYIWIGLGILTLITFAFIYYEFQRKSYAIRQKDIVYNSGLFWQSSIVIPFNRVQHCEVSQGPIDRFYNLAELKIFTAGGASSDLSISGLSPESAARIKDFIVIKTGIDEEE
ncbi:MAG: membrane protein YdbS with pleckstrin-like domain [Saprospiraceae bacterium]|jgi:membrane protein YdbS with pleckstrin-like domain